jgi:Tfp pilus assembly protein PilV
MNIMNANKRRQVGFTIIEALISLVIMGFGILSLAGMQTSLSRNTDVAKQRSEAVRLAQEKIEIFRSYTGIDATVVDQGITSTTALNWNVLDGGTDTITTNAAYTRTWTLGGVSDDPMRGLTVGVAWTDRAGEAQTVSLSTVLSKTDPADSGFLGFPLPLNTNLKRPKNRNLDIPLPAIDLGNGESAVKFGTLGQYVLFGNISGDVVKICTPTLNDTPTDAEITAALTSADTSINNCTQITGYIVAGYVARDSSVSNTDWNAIESGLGIDTSDITRNAEGNTGITCQFGNAVNQSTGAIIANYKYYLCVVPLAAPNSPPSTNGPYNWSGTIHIAGPSAWHTSGNKYYVCRYQYAATNSLTDVNQQNVQPYVEVNKSIDQQNYLVATTSNATSTTAPACPSSMDVANVSAGVLHQDCRSASNNAGYAAACPLVGALTTYTVTYDGNTNTGGTAPIDTSSPYTSGSMITVLGNTGALTKTGGYTFSGWNTVANGSGTAYAAGAPLTVAANTTLYAQWTTQATYSVTYFGNNNTGGTAPTDVNSPYTAGSTITVFANTGSLSNTGYTFSGWNTVANGSGTAYAAGGSLTVAANTQLYAQWVVLPTYTLTYSGNGNTAGSAPSSASYASGATVTVLSNTGVLSKTGYSFNGWNTATDGSGTNYSPGATFTISTNTTLYVKWLQIQLGTPALAWSGSDPKLLSWAAVNGATAYNVSSCSVINSASTISCTPSSPTSQAGTSVTPPTLGTKDTWCYNANATGSPYTNSATSATKCIHRAANGDYSYP